VCGLRSKIFRQLVQIISAHTDVLVLIFGQDDGIMFKQGVRRELCGVAFIYFFTNFLAKPIRLFYNGLMKTSYLERIEK